MTEDEINTEYNIKESVHNIMFTVRDDSQAKGVKFRCAPSELFSAITGKVKSIKEQKS